MPRKMYSMIVRGVDRRVKRVQAEKRIHVDIDENVFENNLNAYDLPSNGRYGEPTFCEEVDPADSEILPVSETEHVMP